MARSSRDNRTGVRISRALNQAIKLSSSFKKANTSIVCGYCGAPGLIREHIIPRSFFTTTKKYKNKLHHNRSINNIVQSCTECNNLANEMVFDNFWSKKQYIHSQIENRYKDLISGADWTKNEIKELDEPLRSFIRQSQMLREVIKIRLENLKLPKVCEK